MSPSTSSLPFSQDPDTSPRLPSDLTSDDFPGRSYLVLAPTMARPNSVYGVVVGVLRQTDGPVAVRAVLATPDDEEVAQGQEVLLPPEMKTIMMKVSP